MPILFFILLFFSCVNDPNIVKEFVEQEKLPVEETEYAKIIVTDNGDLKVKASANSIKRYDDTQPALILEGDVKITFYDNSKIANSFLYSNYLEIDQENNVMIARDNVILISKNSDKLETEQLTFDEKKEKIYTIQKVIITTKKEVIQGEGFESNLDFSQYKLSMIHGVFDINVSSD
jgi:LPS export ABC transporter protein LptC